MVGSDYTYCPMCGCEDGQGCSKDCPSEVMPRLLAENAKLRAALLEIIRLDDGWVPAAQDDYTYGGYMACADIARTALGGDT